MVVDRLLLLELRLSVIELRLLAVDVVSDDAEDCVCDELLVLRLLLLLISTCTPRVRSPDSDLHTGPDQAPLASGSP